MAKNRLARDGSKAPLMGGVDVSGNVIAVQMDTEVGTTTDGGYPYAPMKVTIAGGVAISADSEFPTAAVLTDVNANPTTTIGGSAGLLWNGSTWARAYGDVTNGAYVNIKAAISLPVTGTFYQATQPVSIATAPVLVAGSAIIGKVGIDQTAPGTTNLVALAANQTVDVAQINGVTPLMGAGNTGTGSPRVTIATDQAAVPVTLALLNDNTGPSSFTHTNITSSGSSQTALASNGSAKYRLLQNDDGTNTCYIFLGTPAVVNTGIKLAANGAYEISAKNNNLYTGGITCISGSGNCKILVTEG